MVPTINYDQKLTQIFRIIYLKFIYSLSKHLEKKYNYPMVPTILYDQKLTKIFKIIYNYIIKSLS